VSLVASLLDKGVSHLKKAGIERARAEARILLAYALGVSQEELIAESVTPNPQSMMRFEALLSRRMAREPMAYIIGYREFWSLPFAVGPGVLVPRPESETLIEEALKSFPERNAPLDVLDLGVGSGCLLLSFLHERPQANGIGVDASREALSFAGENTYELGLSQRVALQHGSWTDEVSDVFDVIFSNPPYIAVGEIAGLEPEICYEPIAALSGGSDGFDAYRQLAPILGPRLKPGGRIFLEIGIGQAERISAVFAAAGLATVHLANDLAGIPRCLVLERSRY
jgi:release factor glutamine methyltransferase